MPTAPPEYDTQFNCYLGIDPGASGGIAFILSSPDTVICRSMPATEPEIWSEIKAVATTAASVRYTLHAAIELVGGYIGGDHSGEDGKEHKHGGQPGSAMFKFGMSYGGLRMALYAAGIVDFEAVAPRTWQKALGIASLPRKGYATASAHRTAWKNQLKQKAQELFPHLEVTLKTADALLIAAYCRQTKE